MVSYILILVCTIEMWAAWWMGTKWNPWAYHLSMIALTTQTMVMIYDTAYLMVKGW